MGPEQAEWYFSVVTAQNVRTLPHLVTVAVENAAALAEGAEDTEGDKGGGLWIARIGKNCLPPAFCSGGWPITGRGR